MDIPSIDKTIFLIDRKDLDTQTTMAFQAYANNDLVDVDETDNVNDLKKKLKSADRQVIVTTIQKMQILISKRLQEGTPDFDKIKNLRIAFVVDECHRAVTPKTKRELERFFGRSLWYGFTGTPRSAENPYPQMGDLPRTTEELYGKCLHSYTIQNAIHDKAVLGFQVEHNGPKNMTDETDSSQYDNETHMLKVLDVILNKSYYKLGLQNGKGMTYECMLTTKSIQVAQKYYELLTRVKNGETSLVIDEKIRQVLPDFPKFAITYSVTENEEGSHVNQEKMQKSLNDYNDMFGQDFTIPTHASFKKDVSLRLAHKEKYSTITRTPEKMLDLLIVVDQMLTGFDSKWVNTLYMDKILQYENLIQAMSRTNRLFKSNEKPYGVIKYYRRPFTMKAYIDEAVKTYSGDKPTVLFVEKLPYNLKKLNVIYMDISEVFKSSGVSDFTKLPNDHAEKAKFAQLFKEFNHHLDAAKLQGFNWEQGTYTFNDEETGLNETINLDFGSNDFMALVQRYKELSNGNDDENGNGGSDGDDVPFDLVGYITEIDTGRIDAAYMNSRFEKYLKNLHQADVTEEQLQASLDELHKSFATLTQDEQKYAEIFLHDVQRGEVVVEDGKTLRDYITEYQYKAKNDQIHSFAVAFGLDEDLLKNMMQLNLTEANIDEFGRFDKLKQSVDKAAAKAFLEKIFLKKIVKKIDNLPVLS